MFSKSQIKLIKSLAQKKHRLQHNLYFAEGKKVISELLNSHYVLHSLYTTEDIFKADKEKTFLVTPSELNKISQLKTSQTALAVFQIPRARLLEPEGIILALDGVRDPGNLGTIIRLCDWFGVEQLVCSPDSVDCFNQKVVQATMGSLARVSIVYTDLVEFIDKNPSMPVFGAFMEGENIYSQELPAKGILVLGNEANGISAEVQQLVTQKLSIPRFGKLQETESLNVATATAILLSEFRRGSIEK